MLYLSKKLHVPTLAKYFNATRACCTQISTAKCIMVAFSDTCKNNILSFEFSIVSVDICSACIDIMLLNWPLFLCIYDFSNKFLNTVFQYNNFNCISTATALDSKKMTVIA